MEQQTQNFAAPPVPPTAPTGKPANKLGVFRWAALGLLVGFIIGLFLAKISFALFFASILIFTIWGGYHGSKTKTQQQKWEEYQEYKKKAFVSDEPLDSREKIVIWIFCLLAPVICGGVLYYMWRYKYPTKAKQANKISWIAFSIEAILGIVLKLLVPGQS